MKYALEISRLSSGNETPETFSLLMSFLQNATTLAANRRRRPPKVRDASDQTEKAETQH